MWESRDKKHDGLGGEENLTFLGKGVDFNGVVSFDGTVRIDGCLEGEIHTKGTLVVGEHAVIKGIITVGTLISSGKIKSVVTATEKVQLLKPGILIGEVHTPSFTMEEGAHFQGLCDMGESPWADQGHQETENVPDLAACRGKVRALIEHEPGT